MAKVSFRDGFINTFADLPEVGTIAPDFRLTNTDFKDVSLKDFAGKRIVLNIFPTIDTGVCSASVRRFNSEAEKLHNTVVLCVSMDLPLAHKNFCAAEGLKNVISLSALRTRAFGKDYGVLITSGAWEGLFSRAVVIINEQGKIIYTEQVPAIGQEPDYESALKAIK